MRKNHLFKSIISGFIFLILSFPIRGQQLNFRNYSVDEGLAQSQVYAICEDNNGNIWMGTRGGGLSRFDGINFKSYTVQEGLSNNYIRSIIKDKNGNLLIGTDYGLSKYDGRKFTSYTSKQGLYNEVVNGVMQDRKGTIWIATEDGIFHLEKDTVFRFGRKLGAPLERITCIAEDYYGAVWAGTDHGLYKFENKNGSLSMNHYTTKDGLPTDLITSITSKGREGIWVCTYGGGVAYGNNQFEVINKDMGLASNTVFSCALGEDGIAWFGTAYGISKYVPHEYCGPSTLVSLTETEGLANNTVMCVMKDSFGNMWFGTSGGGVSKLGSERFRHFTAIKGLFGSWVYTICQDKNGDMWFGTSEGGVTKYDGRVYKRYSEKDGFTASKIRYIHEDYQGNLWLGTIADGLYKYDGHSFIHFHNKNGLSSNFINYIISDTSGTVWLATAGGGINCLVPYLKDKYKVRQYKPKDGLFSDRINTLVMDKYGYIWAGTAGGGISRINPGEINPKKAIVNFTLNKGNTGKHIRSAAMDDHGRLFFGTADAGVLIFDGKHFTLINKVQGLASDNIYSLLFDEQKCLWIGTEKGIDKVAWNNTGSIASVRHYGKAEGFTGIETIQNAICKDRGGRIWFGSVKSATLFDPAKERPVKVPLVHITGMNLFFDNIENTPFGKNVQPWYPVPESLVLPYDQNHLSFEFAGIEQTNPESVHYRWKLDGFDKEWSPVSNKHEAVYSNLPPGDYKFQVMAANEINQWNPVPASFSFVISPPFWQTWWFRSITFVVLVISIWLMISYTFKKMKEENKREREGLEVERNLIELEQKALRLQMNPHFLFNCLNSIKGLIAEDKPQEAKIYLSKFAKVMRSTLDHSREAYITLENEIAGLYTYAELEKLSDDKFDFYIDVDKTIDPTFIKIPPLLIQPFVENALIHGIANKEGKGIIKVGFTMEGNFLKCEVEDNGIGREKAKELKQGNVEMHKSTAIAVTQERLNILNKKLNFEAVKISIIDLSDINGNALGTKVELFIPYQEL